jgi:hypothetical protein
MVAMPGTNLNVSVRFFPTSMIDLDEVATVLRSEDRLAEIKRACSGGDANDAERLGMARESLRLLQDLRATVAASSGPSAASSPTSTRASAGRRTGSRA